MSKSPVKSIDRKSLIFVKAKGTVNVNTLARHLNVKWETAKRSLVRLGKKGQVFYYPDMGLWSIWADAKILRHSDDSQTSENREASEKTNVLYARSLPNDRSNVRGNVGERVEKEGFVCHPKTTGKELSRFFVRGHIHGHYSVDILREGRMPSTYADSDRGFHGKWYSKPLNGNIGYFGELTIPDDPKPYSFHALSYKDGSLKKMAVYVHPRFFYYKDNAETASEEFRQQVKDITDILSEYDWKFGKVTLKGLYSVGINDPILASHVAVNHVESDDDAIHFDSSPGKADGVCTEAEIYNDHEGYQDEATLMVELPQRFIGLELKVSRLEDRMGKVESGLSSVVRILESNVDNTDRLISSVEDLSRLTEFNTTVLLGDKVVPPDEEPIGYAKDNKGDAMYG